MLCDELNKIYIRHINLSLIDDEFKYSQEYKQTFLDLWSSCDEFEIDQYDGDTIKMYCNNILLFKYRKRMDGIRLTCTALAINQLNKYHNIFPYVHCSIIESIGNELINIGYIKKVSWGI